MQGRSEILVLRNGDFKKEKIMSNKDTHPTGSTWKQRVFIVVLIILSLVVSAIVLFYFSPARTRSSNTPATNATHLNTWEG
jgi:hypothetical protein